jgi:hypothetical protein
MIPPIFANRAFRIWMTLGMCVFTGIGSALAVYIMVLAHRASANVDIAKEARLTNRENFTDAQRDEIENREHDAMLEAGRQIRRGQTLRPIMLGTFGLGIVMACICWIGKKSANGVPKEIESTRGTADSALENQFYLYIEGAVHGPYTAPKLHDLLTGGQITAETPCCLEGCQDWKKVEECL